MGDREKERQTDGQIFTETDTWRDRQTQKKTDREIHISIVSQRPHLQIPSQQR
jgi:hypothetical protein